MLKSQENCNIKLFHLLLLSELVVNKIIMEKQNQHVKRQEKLNFFYVHMQIFACLGQLERYNFAIMELKRKR